jgi:hypothetical protein
MSKGGLCHTWRAVERDSEKARVGLCVECRFARVIESERGSVFYFCERSRTDPSFPKYPRLPVLRCTGYVPKEG